MSRGGRVNLALGLVTVALAVLALALWRREALAPPGPLLMPDLEPDTVREIRIQAGDKPEVLLERPADRWRMTAPRELPADLSRIERLLQDLRELRIVVVGEAPPLALAPYRLDRPEAQLHVAGRRLAFGAANPLDLRRYLHYDGQVLLAEDLLYPMLSSQALFFAAQELLPPDYSPDALCHAGRRFDLHRSPAPGAAAGGPLADAGGGEGSGAGKEAQSAGAGGFFDGPRIVRAWRRARAFLVEAYAAEEATAPAEGMAEPGSAGGAADAGGAENGGAAGDAGDAAGDGTAATAAAPETVLLESEAGGPLEFRIVARRPLILARPDLGIQYRFSASLLRELLPPETAPAHGPCGQGTKASR